MALIRDSGKRVILSDMAYMDAGLQLTLTGIPEQKREALLRVAKTRARAFFQNPKSMIQLRRIVEADRERKVAE